MRNRDIARKHFGIDGETNYVLHHIDPSLKKEDVERYIQWNIEDLVVMTRAEHSSLHSNKRGTKLSEESKRRIAESKIGTHHSSWNKHRRWYTDGINDVMSYECPDGYHLGRSKYTRKEIYV